MFTKKILVISLFMIQLCNASFCFDNQPYDSWDSTQDSIDSQKNEQQHNCKGISEEPQKCLLFGYFLEKMLDKYKHVWKVPRQATSEGIKDILRSCPSLKKHIEQYCRNIDDTTKWHGETAALFVKDFVEWVPIQTIEKLLKREQQELKDRKPVSHPEDPAFAKWATQDNKRYHQENIVLIKNALHEKKDQLKNNNAQNKRDMTTLSS